jgi:hypothetical protein
VDNGEVFLAVQTWGRPGSIINLFNQILSDKLKMIASENKYIIHMGDYNVDLLKHDTHPPTSEFLDSNLIHSLLPTINKPTKVTSSTATLIDNIFTNFLDSDEVTACILPIDISDHFPICYFSRSITNLSPIAPIVQQKRDLSRKNIDKFNHIISNQGWTPIMKEFNTQLAYSNFHSMFTSTYNKCFPFKKAPTPY